MTMNPWNIHRMENRDQDGDISRPREWCNEKNTSRRHRRHPTSYLIIGRNPGGGALRPESVPMCEQGMPKTTLNAE